MASDTNQQITEELYAKHQKIYPRAVSGIFATWRLMGMLTLLGGSAI